MDGQLKVVITADNKAAIAALNNTDRALNKTADIATRTGSAIAKGSNTAGNALTNLSRIAQDAPFGFIGIQNNLNPMLESFQRLKVESGSTGAALKQMAAGLIGPAGIGVALSVASALFITFGDRLLSASKESIKLAEAQKALSETLSKSIGNAQQEITEMNILVGITQDSTKSIEERKRALNELKSAYPGYNELQKIDITDTDKLRVVTDALTAAIIRKARVDAYASLIAQEEAKQAKISLENDKQRADRLGFLNKAIRDYTLGFMKLIDPVNSNIVQTKLQVAGLEAANDEFDFGSKIIDNYKKSLTKLKEEQIKFDDATKLGGGSKSTTKVANTIDSQRERIQSYKPVGGRLGLTATPERDLEIEQQQVGVSKTYNQLFADRLIMQDSMNEKIALANNLTEMSMGIFEGLGQAMLMGQDLGEALGNTFKRLAVQIAAAALKALVFKSILGAITGGASTGVDAATGGGFGSLFGSIFGGRAIGGVTQGPKSGYPMMLHGTEAVLTPHQMTGIINQSMNAGAMQGMSMNNQMGGGSFVLRGNDLVLALQRSNYALNLRRG